MSFFAGLSSSVSLEAHVRRESNVLGCFLSRSEWRPLPGRLLARAELISKIKGVWEALWQEMKGNETKKMMLLAARSYTWGNRLEMLLISLQRSVNKTFRVC